MATGSQQDWMSLLQQMNSNPQQFQGPAQGFSSTGQYGNIGSALGGGLGMAFGPAGGAIGSAVGGIGGQLIGAKKDRRRKKKLKRKIEQERQTTAAIFGKAQSQQEALARQATQQRLGGFDQAQRAAQLQANTAKQGVLQRGQQQQASLSQGLTNRGLGSTTVGANLGRGIQSDVNRGTSGIDEALGNYFGQLAMGRAGIEAGGTESLANLAGQRASFDIQNANYWNPYNFSRLGAMEGGSAAPQGGFDLSQIYGT